MRKGDMPTYVPKKRKEEESEDSEPEEQFDLGKYNTGGKKKKRTKKRKVVVQDEPGRSAFEDAELSDQSDENSRA